MIRLLKLFSRVLRLALDGGFAKSWTAAIAFGIFACFVLGCTLSTSQTFHSTHEQGRDHCTLEQIDLPSHRVREVRLQETPISVY